MKFLNWLTLATLAMPFHLSAQTAAFEGLEVNISSGWVPLRISSTFENYPNLTLKRDSSKEVPLILSVGYTQALNDRYTVGVSINHDLFASGAVNASVYSNGNLVNSAGSTQWLDNRDGGSLRLGRVLDESNLGYVRVGQAWASQYGTNNNGSVFNSVRFKYMIYGVGVKHLISPTWYALAEIDYVNMVPIKTLKTVGGTPVSVDSRAQGTWLVMGVGYQF